MKKEELITIGVTEEQASKILDINGKDIEHAKAVKDKELATVTAERDDLQNRLTTAEETLAKFDGIDPEKIQEEVKSYKEQAENAEKNFKAQIAARDQKDWITRKLDEYGVKSPLARKQIQAEVMAEDGGLTWKKDSFLGFDDFMKKAKEEDNGLYMTAEEKAAAEKADADKKKEEAAKGNAPSFTAPAGGPGKGGGSYVPPKIW